MPLSKFEAGLGDVSLGRSLSFSYWRAGVMDAGCEQGEGGGQGGAGMWKEEGNKKEQLNE